MARWIAAHFASLRDVHSPPQPTRPPTTVIFDLGGVLIEWDPRHLYRSLFADEASMEAFLAEVATPAWNERQDAGRPWAEAIAELAERHPDQRELIEAYHARWPEMLAGPIEGTVDLFSQLRKTGLRLYALSNWSAETFPIAHRQFPFLDWFDGIVISGDVGWLKPDARIFEHLVGRYAIDPGTAVFIDDSPANVDAARRLGFVALRFVDAPTLRGDLRRLGLLP
jgi:2-haloacid dehalogenase